MSFIRAKLLLIFICSISVSSGTVITLDDRFTKMEAKIFQLEEKVTVLEARNAQLETQVKEQETILISVLVQTRDHSESGSLKSIFKNREAAIRSTGKSGISRTCRELRAADPTLSSGMQWIDPDGQGVGEDPIYVHCNMTSGIYTFSPLFL